MGWGHQWLLEKIPKKKEDTKSCPHIGIEEKLE